MRIRLIVTIIFCLAYFNGSAQKVVTEKQRAEISALIDQYSLARETQDTVLLKRILTADIDQLVSSGEWREGVASAVKGMLRSSSSTPGNRKLTITKIRMINDKSAIVDCKYNIENADGTQRNMRSTFVVVSDKSKWRISAIRNMLPSGQ